MSLLPFITCNRPATFGFLLRLGSLSLPLAKLFESKTPESPSWFLFFSSLLVPSNFLKVSVYIRYQYFILIKYLENDLWSPIRNTKGVLYTKIILTVLVTRKQIHVGPSYRYFVQGRCRSSSSELPLTHFTLSFLVIRTFSILRDLFWKKKKKESNLSNKNQRSDKKKDWKESYVSC